MQIRATPTPTQCESLSLAPELCNMGAKKYSYVFTCVDIARAPMGKELLDAAPLEAVVPVFYFSK